MWSAYNAMVPEQSETEANRVKLAQTSGLLNLIAMIIGIILPIIIQSTVPDAQNVLWDTPSGQMLTFTLPIFASVFGGLTVIFVLITYFTIDESFLPQVTQKESVRAFFREMLVPFNHPNAKYMLTSNLYSNISFRILMTTLLPILTYVVLLQGSRFIIFVGILIPITFSGFFLWGKIIKKDGIVSSFSRSFVALTIPLCAALVLLLEVSVDMKFALALIIVGACMAILCAYFLIPTPLWGAIIDEREKMSRGTNTDQGKTGGVYFGVNNLILNSASAFANMILGFIYTGGREKDAFLLVLSLPIAAVFYLLTWSVCRKIQLENTKKTIQS
jgi:hypothetical protein